MDNNNITIKVHPLHVFMSPLAFIIYSKDFYSAYTSFSPENAFSPAAYYLICRSLELSMKAYLLANGVSRDQIKRSLGHDLHKILLKSKNLGLFSLVSISDEEHDNIIKANRWYVRKGFEYFEIKNIVEGRSTLPDINVLDRLANQLIIKLEPFCLEASDKKP
jgi:hypothetical protein